MTPAPQPSVQEVEALFDRYCRLVDDRLLDQLSEVFTPDCRATYGDQQVESLAALTDHLRSGVAAFAETRHRVSEIEIESPPEGTPSTVAQVVAWHRFVKERPTLTLFGRYRCKLAHSEQGWRFSELVGSEDRRLRGEPPHGP